MSTSQSQEFVASIDCGTTSCRFFVFDEFANVIASEQQEYENTYPRPGWQEQAPEAIIESIDHCIGKVMEQLGEKGLSKENIKAVGITNQRETTLCWSRRTGQPYYPAIAWPDTRNAQTVRRLSQHQTEAIPNEKKSVDVLREKTGLPISTYFSGVKLRWLLDHEKSVREAHDKLDDEGEGEGEFMFGTVDSWILYNYTGGAGSGLHLTDVTNASRTMLFNVQTLQWDSDLIDFFGVNPKCLPKVVSNAEVYGKFASGPLEGIPIAGMIGDQTAAMMGNRCLKKGEAKNTYGTGCFMLYNTGHEPVISSHGLLTTPAFKPGPDAKAMYALEGSIAVAGSSIKWARDQLGLIKETKEIGELAEKVEDTGGVYFVTGFSGLFAPYWDDTATGLLIGVTGYTSRYHIARAILEATCYQTRAILDAMHQDSGHDLLVLRVDGGMTNSDIAMQIQSDILGINVERPDMRESTALGSALLAGHALGLFGWNIEDPETLLKVNTTGQTVFEPQTDSETRADLYEGWERAVERAKGWNVVGDSDSRTE